MQRLALLLALLIPAFAAPGLLGGKPDPVPDDPTIVVNARSLAETDRMEAIAVLEDYVATGSDPALLPIVTIEAGEQRRLSGDPVTARAHFESVARGYPDHPAKQAASLGMALIAFENGTASGNTLATLKLVPDERVPPTMNADRYRLLALAAAKEGVKQSDLDALVAAAYLYAETDASVLGRVDRSLAHLKPADIVVDTEGLPSTDAADEAALFRARSALAAGDTERALELANSMLSTYPDSDLVDEAEWVVRRAEAGDPYNAQTVAVLLPLTGKYAPPGNQIKDVLELGLRGSGAKVVFLDTQGDADLAVEQFEAAVLEHGAALVVGPLLQDEAFPVAKEAQAAQVPLVALTQAPGITELGDYVFQTALTPEHQVEGLLKHVMDDQGMTRFGVLAPESPYGQAAKEAFLRGVMQRGGTVTVQVTYDPAAGDYRTYAQELGDKDTAGRKEELQRLRAQAANRGMDPSKVVLPPKQDFDALFIPDSYQRVILVASALAYEEFAIGAFRPGAATMPVPLLGLNGWHNEKLAQSGGLYLQNCVFVDAFDSSDPMVDSFVQTYRDHFGRAPSVMDAVTWDTAKLVSVASRSAPASREEVATVLGGANISGSVSGGDTLDDDRELIRDMLLFTVNDEQQIQRLDQLAPEEL